MSHKNNITQEYIGDELEVFALAKNWKSYWSSKLKPLLGQRVLEVGAGLGANLALLKGKQTDWVVLEPDVDQAEKIRANHESDETVSVITGTIDLIDIDMMFESIIYIDVLEHIEDDRSELLTALKHLVPNGRLIILSPAHQSLFSPFDLSVGHYRRYDKTTLSSLAPEYVEVEKLYYLDSIGCIASWLNAKLLRSSMPTRGQIWLWDSLMIPISLIMDRGLNYSLGKTVVMVLKKP